MRTSTSNLFVAIGLSGLAWVTASALPVEKLARDLAYPVTSLPKPEPGKQCTEFSLLDEKVYLVEEGRESCQLHRISADNQLTRNVLPQCQPRSLHRQGNRLVFFDEAAIAEGAFDPVTGAVSLQSTGAARWDSFRRTLNGNRIVYSGLMFDRVETDAQYEARMHSLTPDEREKAVVAEEALAKKAVFVLDSSFNLVAAIEDHHDAAHIIDGRDQRGKDEIIDGERHVRVSENGDTIAVFSQHLPGIAIYNRNGIRRTVLTHPGNGVIAPPQAPRPGHRVFYQTDVLVAGDHILVADMMANLIYMLDLAGNVVHQFETPYPVRGMEREGRYLYLRGRADEFGRFIYPKK